MNSITLNSSCLYSKFGFIDGDLIYELGLSYPDSYKSDFGFCHDLLIVLVKKYLLPKLDEDLKIYTFSTHHNPIRVEDYQNFSINQEDNVSVEISMQQIIEEANALLKSTHPN